MSKTSENAGTDRRVFIESVAIHGATMWLLAEPASCKPGAAGCAYVWRSADRGAHWARGADLPVQLEPDGRQDIRSMVATADGRVFVGGAGGVFESTDAGAHFHRVVSAPVSQVALVGAAVWAFDGCEVGGPSRCRSSLRERAIDGGPWRTITLPAGQWVALHVTTARHAQITAQRAAIATSDGGTTWRRLALPCTGGETAVDVTLPAFGSGYLLCPGGASAGNSFDWIYRTADGGGRWTKMFSGMLSGYPSHIAIAADARPALIGVRMAAASSADQGAHWTPVAPPGNEADAGYGELADIANAFTETGFVPPRTPLAFAWSTDLHHWHITPLPH